MTVHPRHEEARYQMARRLSRFFYDNRFGSGWVALAGERFWSRVPKTAGEKHTPSPETRHLILEMLKDLEDAGAARGPSLEEIAGERNDSSWGVPSPDTVPGGPTPQSQGSTIPLGPPGPSEAPAAGTQESEGVKGLPASSPLAASDDVCPPAGIGLSESPRGGQASLPFQKHSEPSRLAAQDPDTRETAAAMRLRVAQLLRERGPLTDDQIADALGVENTEKTRIRRIDLKNDGLVVEVGRGLSRKGRSCAVWGLVEMSVSA